jgi:threonine synthase
MTVPWTSGMSLRCSACGATEPPGLHWFGCGQCGGPFDVVYADPDGPALPIAPELRTELAARPAPLVEWADKHTMLKLEFRNPTGSHKDRFHSVTSAIARLCDAPGVVTTSTGNHGVSCAAHAARDGLRCVVLSTQSLPRALAWQIHAHGAQLARLEAAGRRAALLRLVDAGWVPATSSDPRLSGAGNPYGADGYRSIADEVLADLGRLPDAVLVPIASGDTVVGVARGFAAAAARAGMLAPLIVGCQPEGAATISAWLREGQPVRLDDAYSVARSTADPLSGRLAIDAVRNAGLAVAVPDDEIIRATRDLAAAGFYVETSSALAVAGARVAREQGQLAPDALAVALLTANGRGWSEDTPGVLTEPVWASSVDELSQLIGLAPEAVGDAAS